MEAERKGFHIFGTFCYLNVTLIYRSGCFLVCRLQFHPNFLSSATIERLLDLVLFAGLAMPTASHAAV